MYTNVLIKSKGSSSFADSIDRFLTCLAPECAPYLRNNWLRIIWQLANLIQAKRESKLTYILGVNGESNIIMTEWIEILTFCIHDCWLGSLPKETRICTLSPTLIPSEDIYNDSFTKKLKQQYNKSYYLVLFSSKKKKKFQSGH